MQRVKRSIHSRFGGFGSGGGGCVGAFSILYVYTAKVRDGLPKALGNRFGGFAVINHQATGVSVPDDLGQREDVDQL